MARPKAGVTFHDRVREKTVIDDATGCHNWMGHKNQDGYGRIWRGDGLVFIHRSLWQDRHGPIPEGMKVCHTCDNPACLNDEHHFLGTQTENIADMDRKGRRRPPIGSRNAAAKLDEAKAREIKLRLREGAKAIHLASEFGVSNVVIGLIKRDRAWRHVTV